MPTQQQGFELSERCPVSCSATQNDKLYRYSWYHVYHPGSELNVLALSLCVLRGIITYIIVPYVNTLCARVGAAARSQFHNCSADSSIWYCTELRLEQVPAQNNPRRVLFVCVLLRSNPHQRPPCLHGCERGFPHCPPSSCHYQPVFKDAFYPSPLGKLLDTY